MPWYAAHIVMTVHIKGKRQSRFPVWENIVLIKAKSEREAFLKAEENGHANEGDDDGTFRWDGQPATWLFAGIRKLALCVDPRSRPNDGTEITFNEYLLDSKEAVEKYAAGDQVNLLCRDQFREGEDSNGDNSLVDELLYPTPRPVQILR
jgi:hypothetical protein